MERYQRFSIATRIIGSGSDRVVIGMWLNGRFRSLWLRTPVNLSGHSWRYAIRQVGLLRALCSGGFVRA